MNGKSSHPLLVGSHVVVIPVGHFRVRVGCRGGSCFGVGRVQNSTRYEVLGREAKRSSLLEETDREREKGLERKDSRERTRVLIRRRLST
jgi:hypothetical protein